MSVIVVKLILVISLLIIFYQDFRKRAVWWFLFPLFLLASGYLHYVNSIFNIFLLNSGLNFLIMSIILSISFLYAQLKLRVSFFKEAFGLGDLLFFIGLTVAFPTISFIVLFVFSLLFALGLHLLLSVSDKKTTVPLAGYSSLFFLLIYLAHWSGLYKNLYLV